MSFVNFIAFCNHGNRARLLLWRRPSFDSQNTVDLYTRDMSRGSRSGASASPWLFFNASPRSCLGLNVMTSKLRYDIIILNFHPLIFLYTCSRLLIHLHSFLTALPRPRFGLILSCLASPRLGLSLGLVKLPHPHQWYTLTLQSRDVGVMLIDIRARQRSPCWTGTCSLQRLPPEWRTLRVDRSVSACLPATRWNKLIRSTVKHEWRASANDG